MRRRRFGGRLVFPAADSLVASALRPFPPILVRDDRCGFCRGRGVSFAFAPHRGGHATAHTPECPYNA